MTAPDRGATAAEARTWQDGDRAWADRAMWVRAYPGERCWGRDSPTLGAGCLRTDDQMTRADAVLVATADGPVATPRELQAGLGVGSSPVAARAALAGAIRPQVLDADTPEPARPWTVVMDPADPAGAEGVWTQDFPGGWQAIVPTLSMTAASVYVITGEER